MDVRLLCLLCVVLVAASATSWSLFRNSRTPCVCLIVCDPETWTMRRPGRELGCSAVGRKKWRYEVERTRWHCWSLRFGTGNVLCCSTRMLVAPFLKNWWSPARSEVPSVEFQCQSADRLLCLKYFAIFLTVCRHRSYPSLTILLRTLYQWPFSAVTDRYIMCQTETAAVINT
jgi:hypothetical protein